MKKIFYVLLVSLLLSNCSTSDDSPSQEATSEIDSSKDRFIKEMQGEDVLELYYEDGLLLKGVGNSSTSRDHYLASFQVEYNSNNKVERVLVDHNNSIPKPTDFSFDLSEQASNLEVYNYNYKNGKLATIVRENGFTEDEFFYDNEGKMVKTIYNDEHYEYSDETEYIYASNGQLTSYIYYNSSSGETNYGDIIVDNEMNPFYILWKNYSFIMPGDFAHSTNFILPFTEQNILKIYEADNLEVEVNIEYEEGYPKIYHPVSPDEDATLFLYIE